MTNKAKQKTKMSRSDSGATNKQTKTQSAFVRRYLSKAAIKAREEEQHILWAGKMMNEIRSHYGASLPESVVEHFFADLMELDESHPARLTQCDIEAIVERLSEEE